MTSQLILGNGFGVAIASDSATTTANRVRTYEDAEKINPLADPHRLAVLQSGSVNLLGMPVGVLLDDWKNSLGGKQRTVEGYRDNFLTWLQDNLNNWTTSTERDGKAWWCLDRELRDVWKEFEETLGPGVREEILACRESDMELPADRHEEVLRIIRKGIEEVSEFEIFDSGLNAIGDEIFDRLSQEGADGRPALSTLVNRWFGDFGSDEITQELHRFLRLLVGRSITFPNGTRTFLAFTGYGANDLLPNMSGVQLYGAIGNHVCRYLWSNVTADPFGSSYVMVQPLAQRDMIDLVLRGWDEELAEDAAEATFERITGQETRPADPAGMTGDDDTRGGQGNAGHQDDTASPEEDWRAALMDETRDLAWKSRGERAYRTIASLPLSSLANAAGSLVSIQNLKQNIRGELPTVGGKINVATITRSEGFQWVSRQDDD